MEISVLKVVHEKRKYKSGDKAKVYVDGCKNDFLSLPPGNYALVKMETVNDEFAVRDFAENLKK